MRFVVALLSILYTPLLFSQDVSGIWRGSFNSSDKLNDLFGLEDKYKFEVQLDQGKQFKGVTYSYKTTVFYGKAAARGTFNAKTGKVLLEELKTIEVKMATGEFSCIMTCFLQYTKNGPEEIMEGKYSSYRESDSSFCGKGTVILRKVSTSDFKKEPFIVKKELDAQRKKNLAKEPLKKISGPLAKSSLISPGTTAQPATVLPNIAVSENARKPIVVNIPPVLKTRENKLVRTISVNTNLLTINIYDNGTIDHDTVSVYLDNKLVISRQMLKTTPISFTIPMDDNENNYHEVVMVAENLGDIPPNTALMVVKAGDKEYEVHITSTEQRNAVIAFKYDL
jgi:hypothetical protein